MVSWFFLKVGILKKLRKFLYSFLNVMFYKVI